MRRVVPQLPSPRGGSSVEGTVTLLETKRIYLYFPSRESFRDRAIFVAYWHTERPGNSLIEPHLYEHAARGDLEVQLLIRAESSSIIWSYVDEDKVEVAVKYALNVISVIRGSDLQVFLQDLWRRISLSPLRPFRVAFR